MTYNAKTKQYVYEYKAKNIKRVPLDMQLSEYEELKAAADASGMKVNAFIKQAIKEAIAAVAGPDPVQAAPPPEGEKAGG